MTQDMFFKSLDRRTLLKILSFTGISGLIYPRNLLAGYVPLDLIPIAVVQHDSATNGSQVNGETVELMLNRGVMAITNQLDPGEAWKSLFPGITASSMIAIKVNTLFLSMPTHPGATYALCECLRLMDFNGTPFPENNIIIYDNANIRLQQAGYTINTSAQGVRCFGTDQVGYTSNTYPVAGTNQRISRILTDTANYLINFSVLKNHSISGITLSLKNHLGTCNSPGSMHSNHADPYIAALNALPVIDDIHCLSIIDALWGIRSGGPGGYPQFTPNKIIMSKDVVAGDYVGRQLLADNGCNTTGIATHVDTASTVYNLGTNDPGEMDIINITNPTTDVDNDGAAVPEEFQLDQNFPNPFNGTTQIRFYAPRSSDISMKIFNVRGQSVRDLVDRAVEPGWHNVVWDGKNDSGSMVSSGVYFCRMQSRAFDKSIILEFIK
jgi:uncharacterized protein (DUF362 family)